MKRTWLLIAALAMSLPIAVGAQDPPVAQDPPAGGGRGGGRAQEPQIRPYERVITKEAESDEGVFNVHRIGDRVFYEIPKDMLGRDFLWVSQIAKTTLGAGYGGQAAGNRVVRWERRGDRILLRGISYDVVADPSTPIARAVDAANHSAILMAFNIEALGKEDAAVIDVTRLFTSDVPEFSGRTRVAAYAALDFLADVRKGVWSEIYAAPGSPVRPIDAYRRNLQRAYIETLGNRVNGPQAQSDDVRAFFRGELKVLDGDLERAQAGDHAATRMHVYDVRAMIARALDPTTQPVAAGTRTTTTAFDGVDLDSCWPDYVVRRRN